ncbi:MAG: hypothetical protein COB53_00575 [Elusimicrobia bacterium]|nr:MAG: hypothetical protein COB53_00575 [Elusimicrobiota bacterium]
MNFKHWMPVLLALAVGSAPAAALEDKPVPKDWTTLQGSISGVTRYRTVDVQDDETWQKLWKEHTALHSEAPPAPFVDFKDERVIAIFLGSRAYGHGVDLAVKRNKTADSLTVFVKEGKPSKNRGFGITMMEQPYVFRRETKEFTTVIFPTMPGALSAPTAQVEKKIPAPKKIAQTAHKTIAAWTENLSGLRDSVASLGTVYDGSSAKTAAASVVLVGGKPLPGQRQEQGKPLPGDRQETGKPLPGQQPPKRDKPLPGQGGGGKPLPGQGGGKPLPGGGTVRHPRPSYPGGPLPSNDPRLEGADRTYSTYGMQYVGYWNGKTYYKTSQGTLDRSGKNPGTRYTLTLTSRRVKKQYDFYYSAADKAYYWVPDETPVSGRRTRDLSIVFSNTANKPLHPWESERFVFSLTGSQLSLDSQKGAYRYTGTFTSDANDATVVTAHLTAGAKVLTAADPKGVSLGIQSTGSRLKFVVTDKWGDEYAGETIEIAAVVRWDDGSRWRRDPIIIKYTQRSPLQLTTAKSVESTFTTNKRGKHYIESWSFRRANSQISSSRWINKGKGNSVTH